MFNMIKKGLKDLIKASVIIVVMIIVLLSYPYYKAVIAEDHAHNFCDIFKIGNEVTLNQLIKLSIDSETPPFFSTITSSEHRVNWTKEKGWSKNNFDFQATSFEFTVDWRGFFFDSWACIVMVEKGKITNNQVIFFD